jgi:hypothetical protein
MVKLMVTKVVKDQLGTTVELSSPEGITTRFEVFGPRKVPELYDWAEARKLGDEVVLNIPWSGLSEP